jgi:hypothetical protein
MDGVYGMRGRYETCIQNFGQKPEGRDHLKGLSVDGRIMFEWI